MVPTMQSIVCRNPDIVTNEIDGNIVMMSISEGNFLASMTLAQPFGT